MAGHIGHSKIKNTSSGSAPTVDFDDINGYEIGSEHVQTGTDGNVVWKCSDASTGVAVWDIYIGEGSDTTNVSEHGKVNTVDDIDIGQAAYINGQSGAIKPKFGLGDRTAHDPAHLSGLAKESKTNSQDIEVIRIGKIIGTTEDPLNTSTFSDNPPERLHLSTSGDLVGDTPGGGGAHLEVGRCIRSHATEGVIEVNIADYIHSIRAWVGTGGIIELAFGSNDNTDWISIQRLDGTEIVKITTDGVYTDDIKEYTADAGITADGVLLKDSNVIADNIQEQYNTGVIAWGGAGDYYDAAYLVSDGKLKITRTGDGLIKSSPITWAAPQETGAIAANATTWVYFDSSGDIQSTTTRTNDLFKNNTVVYEVFYDGTNYIVVKEDHPACYPICVSNHQHSENNVVFDSLNGGGQIFKVAAGDGSSADDRRIMVVGATQLLDHGLDTTVPDSSGVGVTVYHSYSNGSVQWVMDSIDSEFPMKYNNSGTPTALGIGKYGVFRVATSKDDKNTSTPKQVSIMHTETFNTIVQARNAIEGNGGVSDATGELASIELAQIGFVIVQNNANGGIIAEATPAKKVAVSNITGQQNLASLVQTDTTNFDNILSTEANVQDALDTLDDHIIPDHSDTTATGAELDTLTDGSEASTLHLHDLDYFQESEYINSSGGGGDSGKPIVLDAGGQVDATMINDADVSHDGTGGYSADQHTKATITQTFDGGGSVLETGEKNWIRIPFACTITGLELTADQTGSIVIDIWKDTYANYPPTVADTITASAKPTLSSAIKAQDNVLSGWTTSVTAGDYLKFNIDSVSTVTLVVLQLQLDIT